MFCGRAFSVTPGPVNEETSCGFPTRPRPATPVPFKYSIAEPVPAPRIPFPRVSIGSLVNVRVIRNGPRRSNPLTLPPDSFTAFRQFRSPEGGRKIASSFASESSTEHPAILLPRPVHAPPGKSHLELFRAACPRCRVFFTAAPIFSSNGDS